MADNTVCKVATIIVQPVRGIQEMPRNRGGAISQIADNPSIFQAVFQHETINGAMAEIYDQIGGGENCTSCELGHM